MTRPRKPKPRPQSEPEPEKAVSDEVAEREAAHLADERRHPGRSASTPPEAQHDTKPAEVDREPPRTRIYKTRGPGSGA